MYIFYIKIMWFKKLLTQLKAFHVIMHTFLLQKQKKNKKRIEKYWLDDQLSGVKGCICGHRYKKYLNMFDRWFYFIFPQTFAFASVCTLYSFTVPCQIPYLELEFSYRSIFFAFSLEIRKLILLPLLLFSTSTVLGKILYSR